MVTPLWQRASERKVECLWGHPLQGASDFFDLICFEDIAFRFLYWKNPVLLGEGERIKLQETWKLRLTNPDEIGPYGVVLLWVDQNSGAMLKLEGYDRKGRLTKKYEVSKVQKSSQNEWMLEEMKVETIDPNTGDTVGSPTYMEVEEAKRK